jgi:hypothetical protein
MSPRTTAPPKRRARSFRLGEAQEKRSVWLPAVIAFVVAAVVFGGAGYLIGRPGEQDRMAEDIRSSDAARDKEQIKSLTDLARTTRDQLMPVVAGLKSGAGDVAGWQKTVDAAVKSFDDPPSGSTATNVARGSIAAAVDQLALAVTTFGTDKALAAKQLNLAITTWSIGATQLDQINVDAGYGHQHVYLQSDPDGEAFTPDSAEEGTG